MQGVPVSKARAIILKEWKEVMTRDKKMKKYKEMYEEEKRLHEVVLQRYQEDHMDKMETIRVCKRRNKKARKVSQPKKASGSHKLKKASVSPKSDEPKKVSESQGLIDDPNEEGRKPKKASRSSDGKKIAT